MKLYRVTTRRAGNEHDGYSFFTNKAQAESVQKKRNKILYIDSDDEEQESANPQLNHDEVEELEFELSKKGILDLLKVYCSYPDNG